MIESIVSKYNSNDLPDIAIVRSSKIGKQAISAYDHDRDVIYFNSRFNSSEKINHYLQNDFFAAKDVKGILRHELGHREHWLAAKRFYKLHKRQYNSIEDAKQELDSEVLRYVKEQELFDGINIYLTQKVSRYAATRFNYFTKNFFYDQINEIIAEFYVNGKTEDVELDKLIKKVLNYGKA